MCPSNGEPEFIDMLTASKFDPLASVSKFKVNFRQDGQVEIDMPFIDGEPKIKYVLSQKVWLNMCSTFSWFSSIFWPKWQQINEISFGHVAAITNSPSITGIYSSDVEGDTSDISLCEADVDASFSTSCSSTWGSPMSPRTFHDSFSKLINNSNMQARMINSQFAGISENMSTALTFDVPDFGFEMSAHFREPVTYEANGIFENFSEFDQSSSSDNTSFDQSLINLYGSANKLHYEPTDSAIQRIRRHLFSDDDADNDASE